MESEMNGVIRRTLRVLVPKPQSAAACLIETGSGVVAEEATRPGRLVEVYFEGNRYNAENLRTYGDRIKHAAGRLLRRYPTTARGFFDASDFVVVGTYELTMDWKEQNLRLTDRRTVAGWTGETIR